MKILSKFWIFLCDWFYPYACNICNFIYRNKMGEEQHVTESVNGRFTFRDDTNVSKRCYLLQFDEPVLPSWLFNKLGDEIAVVWENQDNLFFKDVFHG